MLTARDMGASSSFERECSSTSSNERPVTSILYVDCEEGRRALASGGLDGARGKARWGRGREGEGVGSAHESVGDTGLAAPASACEHDQALADELDRVARELDVEREVRLALPGLGLDRVPLLSRCWWHRSDTWRLEKRW